MSDESTSREQLIQELAEVRRRLDAAEQALHQQEANAAGHEQVEQVYRSIANLAVLDVTERERAMEALRASEEELTLTLDATTDGIWKWDFESNEFFFSSRYYTMLGYEPGEFPASYESWMSLIHPDDLQQALAVAEEYLATKPDNYENEFRLRTKSGDYRWIRTEARVVARDERGQALRMIGNHWDITERKRAEEALRESEIKFRTLVDRAPVALFLHDMAGYIVDVNQVAVERYGYSRAQLLQMKAGDIDPDYVDREDGGVFWRNLAKQGYFQFKARHRRQDGSIFPVNVSLSAIELGGEKHVLALAEDITERKRAEEALERRAAQLALLNDIGGQIVAELDLDLLLPRAVRLVQENFGYHHVALFTLDRKRGELVMRARAGKFGHLFPPDHRLEMGQGLVGWVGRQGQTLLANDVSTEPRYVSLHPDQMPTRAELAVPIRAGGEVLGVLDVQSPLPDTFDEDDVLVIETVANQIAVALENAKLYESVQQELAERKQADQALRRRTEQLEALRQVGLELTSELDITTLLDSIITRAVDLLESSVGGLYLYLPEEDVLELVVATGLKPDMIGTKLRPGEGVAGQVWDSGEPLVVEDYGRWSGRALAYENYAFAGVVGVPVRWRDESLGVLNVTTHTPRTFPEADAELLSLFATQAAIAIHNARLFEAESQTRQEAEARAVELRKRERHLALLNAITLTALETRTVEAMLQILADRLAHLIGADGCYVTLWDEARQRVVPAAASGPMSETYPALEVKEGEPTVTEAALRLGRPLAIEDVFDSPHASLRIASQFPARSLLGLPLVAGDQKLGAALIAFNEPHHFSPEEISIGQQAARQISLALAKGRLLEQEREQRQLAETLRQVGAAVNSSLNREKVLAVILEQLARVVPYDNASVILVTGNKLELVAQRGFGTKKRLLPPMSVDELPHVQHVLKSQQAAIIADVRDDPGWKSTTASQDVRCWLGVPLVIQERAIGLLNLGHEQEGFYSEEDASVIQAFAAHAAIAIENTELFTQAKQAYEKLKETQAQLVQSAKLAAIGQLAAGVAHELNNPLTSVLGFAELVVRKLEPEDPNRRDLEIVAGEARRARHIVRNLLDFARQSESRKQRQDLNHLVRQTLALTRIQLDKDGIEIEEHYDPDLDLVPLDAGQMRQVLLNLITNAAQAMPQGGTLAVRTTQVGDQARVSIADTGVGIPEKIQERIFEPFFTTRSAGTGLGLSVSLGIVQGHGGQIELDSRLGKGSTFVVTLPMTKQSEGETHV